MEHLVEEYACEKCLELCEISIEYLHDPYATGDYWYKQEIIKSKCCADEVINADSVCATCKQPAYDERLCWTHYVEKYGD